MTNQKEEEEKEDKTLSDLKAHYEKTLLEPLELMIINFTVDELKGFIKGNILKYSMRANFKGQLAEDRVKLDWYLKLFMYMEKHGWNDLLNTYRDFKASYFYAED